MYIYIYIHFRVSLIFQLYLHIGLTPPKVSIWLENITSKIFSKNFNILE